MEQFLERMFMALVVLSVATLCLALLGTVLSYIAHRGHEKARRSLIASLDTIAEVGVRMMPLADEEKLRQELAMLKRMSEGMNNMAFEDSDLVNRFNSTLKKLSCAASEHRKGWFIYEINGMYIGRPE